MSEDKAKVQEVTKEITSLEDAKARIAELEALVTPKQPVKTPEELKKEQEQQEKQYAYFQEMSRGAGFIKFIIADLFTNKNYNRQTKRLILNQLVNKKFTKDLVNRYSDKVDMIIEYIEENIKHLVTSEDIKAGEKVTIANGKVFATVRPEPVDAVELYEKAKEEAKDEV